MLCSIGVIKASTFKSVQKHGFIAVRNYWICLQSKIYITKYVSKETLSSELQLHLSLL